MTRVEHVGSLVRPEGLSETLVAAETSGIVSDELRSLQDRHIAEAVKRQEEIGLEVVSDGELRRSSWHRGFAAAICMRGPVRCTSTISH